MERKYLRCSNLLILYEESFGPCFVHTRQCGVSLCIVSMRKEKWRQKLLKFLVLFRGKIYNLRSNDKTKVLLHQAESSILEFIYIYIYIYIYTLINIVPEDLQQQ